MNWKIVKLGEHSNIKYGYTASASSKEVGPKFLRITDIQDGSVNWDDVPYCTCSSKDYEKYMLEDDDIVFARTGATTGKSYLLSTPQNAVFASYLIRVRVDQHFIPEYVYNFFQSSIYWNQINVNISGSAQGGVNATKLSNLKVIMPPLEEQKQIVELLADFTATIKKYNYNYESIFNIRKKLLDKFTTGVLIIPQEALRNVQ